MGSRADRYNQIAQSVLMQEHEQYMDEQVLTDQATQNPQTENREEAAPTVPVSEKGKNVTTGSRIIKEYKAPFTSIDDSPKTHRYQASVNDSTLKNIRVLGGLYGLSVSQIVTTALEEWIDRKIKEYNKMNK